jgi:hypothetical protein
LVTPEPRHAHRRAQFPGFCLLLACNRQRTLKIGCRFHCIRLRRLKRDLSGEAIDFGFEPPFLGCFHRCDRFVNAAPSIIDLSKFCMSERQI